MVLCEFVFYSLKLYIEKTNLFDYNKLSSTKDLQKIKYLEE